MDTKKFLLGTVAGGIVYFFLGFLLYGILLESFFASNMGSATGVSRGEEIIFWALILGNLSSAALLTYVFLQWAGIASFAAGLKAGLIMGLFMALGFDMIVYATSNMMNLTAAFADMVVYSVMTAITGGAIGWVLGMGK